MAIFKIPVSWEVFSTVNVEADSLDEAIAKFDKDIDNIPLPKDGGEYIDGSFKRDDEETCSANNL